MGLAQKPKFIVGCFTCRHRRKNRSRPSVLKTLLAYHFTELMSEERREWREAALREEE